MSWSIEEHIGEGRPWPEQVVVYRGETDESLTYVKRSLSDVNKMVELMDTLAAENAKLLDENARLRSCLSDDADNARQIMAENAKLRELVRDMYGFIQSMDEDCGDVIFSDCFDYCKHEAADDGCRKIGKCWYDRRMHELGVEVEG